MSVERDKTGLRRCKQRGRSQSCCLLRRRRQEKRQAQAGTLKSRRHSVRPSGRGARGEATIEHLVPSQRSRHRPGVF